MTTPDHLLLCPCRLVCFVADEAVHALVIAAPLLLLRGPIVLPQSLAGLAIEGDLILLGMATQAVMLATVLLFGVRPTGLPIIQPRLAIEALCRGRRAALASERAAPGMPLCFPILRIAVALKLVCDCGRQSAAASMMVATVVHLLLRPFVEPYMFVLVAVEWFWRWLDAPGVLVLTAPPLLLFGPCLVRVVVISTAIEEWRDGRVRGAGPCGARCSLGGRRACNCGCLCC